MYRSIQKLNKTVKHDLNKPFGIIYKVTCETNGKIYIGQTIKNDDIWKSIV